MSYISNNIFWCNLTIKSLNIKVTNEGYSFKFLVMNNCFLLGKWVNQIIQIQILEMNNIDWLYSSQKVCIWFINPCLLYLKCVWHTFLFCLFKILLEYQQTDTTDTLDLTQIHRMLIIIWRLQNHDDKIESVNMIMKECWAFVTNLVQIWLLAFFWPQIRVLQRNKIAFIFYYF